MKDTLMKFMEKAGKNNEFKMFFNLYHELPKIKFAVIKISGKVLEENMEAIAEDIAALNKLGIYPVIVHGAGAIIDKRLPKSQKIEHMRVTSKEDMIVIKEVFTQLASDLKLKIIEKGGSAGVCKNVYKCEQELPKFGYVGKITDVELQEIEMMLENNITPIISPIGSFSGSDLNINADTAAKELVKKIQPKKYILVTDTGGVLDKYGKLIHYINVSIKKEYRHVTGGMMLKLEETKEFVKLNPDCSVIITGPDKILEELFTIKGSGTFIKYHVIRHTKNPTGQDKEKIKALIETVFEKKLKDDYFKDVSDVYYEKDFEGVAVMKKLGDIPYMDKFAVAKIRQGTGLGQSIWDDLVDDYPKFAWRATQHNPVNSFYFKNCSGMMKKNGWNVYWVNLDDSEVIPIVKIIAEKEVTWLPEETVVPAEMDGIKKDETPSDKSVDKSVQSEQLSEEKGSQNTAKPQSAQVNGIDQNDKSQPNQGK